MKKSKKREKISVFLIIMLCLSLCSCNEMRVEEESSDIESLSSDESTISSPSYSNKHIKRSEEYNLETDCPVSFYEGSLGPFVRPAPNGYYAFVGQYLYFMDKESGFTVPVCNKPECRHSAETDPERIPDCNAYFFVDQTPFLQYYEGNVYVAARYWDSDENPKTRYALIRVSPDGSTRDYLCQLDVNSYSSYIIHRGCLYTYTINPQGVSKLSRVPMDDLRAEEEVLFEEQSANLIFHPLFYGNHLYLNHSYMTNDKQDIHSQIWDYDLQTGTRTAVFNEEITADDRVSCAAIYQDSFFLYGSTDDGQAMKYELFDRGSGETQAIATFAQDYISEDDGRTVETGMRADQKQLYTYEKITADGVLSFQLSFVNEKLEKVRVDCKEEEMPTQCYYCPGDDRYLFTYCRDRDFNYSLFILDKASSDTELKEIVSLSASRAFPSVYSYPIISGLD